MKHIMGWICIGMLGGCAAPAVSEPSDEPQLEAPPPGGKPGAKPAPAPDDSLLPPPPMDVAPPPPRTESCDGVPVEGACRGSVAVWCEDGQLRSVDCAPVGRVCEYIDAETGFYCGGFRSGEGPPVEPEPESDPLPAPPEGEEEGEAPPPGDPPPQPDAEPEEPGAPPPPEEEEAPSPPDDEGEPEAPMPPDPPEEEEGEGAPQPPIPEPGEDGEGAPEPPNGAPPPENVPVAGAECGDLSFHGTCFGSLVVYCQQGRVAHHDCASTGETCGWYDDEWGNWCVQE